MCRRKGTCAGENDTCAGTFTHVPEKMFSKINMKPFFKNHHHHQKQQQ